MVQLRVLQVTLVVSDVAHLVKQATQILHQVDLAIMALKTHKTQHTHFFQLTRRPEFDLLVEP